MRSELNVKLAAHKAAKSISGVAAMVAIGVALGASSVSAHAAAPDYSAFKSALGAPGILSPDNSTISFPLFRQDLSLTISLDGGKTSFPAPSESVANGYIAIEETGPATYFFTGAFPAKTAELPALEATLEAYGLPITAISQQVAGLSTQITTVHIEGSLTESDAALASAFAAVVKTIKTPQLSVSVLPASPSLPSLPPKFQGLVDSGVFEILDSNVLIFALPLSSFNYVSIGTAPAVQATPSLGFQSSIFISGYGYSVLNAEIPLTKKQLQPIEDMLVSGGFTISATSNYYTDASKEITFVHAVATSPTQDGFYNQGEVLGKVLLKVK